MRLDEAIRSAATPVSAGSGVNRSARAPPLLELCLEAELFRALDAAVTRHPGHHFRGDKMPALAAAFPDAMVGLIPYLGEMFEYGAFQRPASFVELEFGHPRLVERVDQLAIDVELQLGMSGV